MIDSDSRFTVVKSVKSKTLLYELERQTQVIKGTIESFYNGDLDIKYISLVYKIGDEGQPWLLFCTSIGNNFQGLEKKVGKAQFLESIPDYINPTRIIAGQNSSDIRESIVCPSCEKSTVPSDFFEIEYRNILSNCTLTPQSRPVKIKQKGYTGTHSGTIFLYDDISMTKDKKQLERKPLINIPRIISILHPEITEESFLSMHKNQAFLNQTAIVCSSCFLKYTKEKEPSFSNNINKIGMLKGSTSLLNLRREIAYYNLKGIAELEKIKDPRCVSLVSNIYDKRELVGKIANKNTLFKKSRKVLEKSLLELKRKNDNDIDVEIVDFEHQTRQQRMIFQAVRLLIKL